MNEIYGLVFFSGADFCKIYKLSAEDVVAHWVNVSISKLGGVEPTVSNLRVLEEALTSEQQKKANVNFKHASPQVDDILSVYPLLMCERG